MHIEKATLDHAHVVAGLALLLWPDNTLEGLKGEFEESLQGKAAVCFLAIEDEQPKGFAQCSIRNDYVEGTDGGPVGYLEGIYVMPDYRHKGVARQLIQACEAWSKEQGCRQFASDCELDNEASLAFHLRSGFTEVNRLICFVKDIG